MDARMKLWRMRYTTSYNAICKDWSELWLCNKMPTFSEVAKYWQAIYPYCVVRSVKAVMCDTACDGKHIVKMEI